MNGNDGWGKSGFTSDSALYEFFVFRREEGES